MNYRIVKNIVMSNNSRNNINNNSRNSTKINDNIAIKFLFFNNEG